jgi:glucan phosphoethanolaminetransferase (alkaline phosphatase superfamily)
LVIGLLTLLSGFGFKNKTVQKTALGIFIFSAISAAPAFLSGGAAEEMIEKYPGISETYIDKHEEAAELFVWLIAVLGLLSLLAFFAEIKQLKFARWLKIAVVAASIIALFFAKQAGTTGGEIRHPEIRNTIAPINNQSESEAAPKPDND